MTNKAVNTKEQDKKLAIWQERFEMAKQSYSSQLQQMDEQEGLYNGERSVNINPNYGYGKAGKVSANVRNITYELIESEVDSSIPMPKVTPIHEEDAELANIIEQALQNEIRRLHFDKLNDISERTAMVQGGDFFHVEWDASKGFHCTIGGLSVNERHPRSVIPQPGVTEVQDMDYIFVLISQTKDYIKRRYGVDVEGASDTEIDFRESEGRDENENIVTVVKCYYRGEDGKIGLFTWCEDYVLEDMKDYQARHLMRCTKCGRIKTGDVCECGCKKFEDSVEDAEEVTETIITMGGLVVDPFENEYVPELDENGAPKLDEFGMPIEKVERKTTKLPYYKPDELPIVLRRNVTKHGRLLGVSDAAIISDQQDAIKKLGNKMQEKILKGGSIVTLPRGLKIETTDQELKVVRIDNPSQIQMVDVRNIQADITMDRIMLETNYDWAKSTLGITDSYQGKYDSSATSGTAKQYSINQAAGRLESKRVMKNSAYASLYELMFKFMLAYADQPIPISQKDENGQYHFSHFSRYDFLKMDESGNLYWNDEFLFETDPTSTIMMNREAMWQQIDLKYQAGAFGPIGEPETLLTYWTFMEKNDYPNSAVMKDIFAGKVQEQKQQEQQMALMQAMGGGNQNAMPPM